MISLTTGEQMEMALKAPQQQCGTEAQDIKALIE